MQLSYERLYANIIFVWKLKVNEYLQKSDIISLYC